MIEDALFVLTLLAALGSGLIGGVFFAFSTFVMRALARLPPAHGLVAMQSINVTVLHPWFLGPFLGTTVACLLLGGWALLEWERQGAAYLLAGCLAYVIGTFGVTAAGNVPLNQRLEGVDPESADAASRWASYVPRWTAWNHVRTAAALLAATALTVALLSR
jgi:uncharacterized membrane protein